MDALPENILGLEKLKTKDGIKHPQKFQLSSKSIKWKQGRVKTGPPRLQSDTEGKKLRPQIEMLKSLTVFVHSGAQNCGRPHQKSPFFF